MERKIKYQYSYFVYPFVIDKKRYPQYLLKLLKDKQCKLKLWEKEKDLQLYTYFLPNMREYLFWSFALSKEQKNEWKEVKDELKASILSQKPCNMFEYTLGKEVQGKIGERNGIFFEIPKIELVCFQTGICFLLIKTTIEGEENLSEVLNFNYKFRDINSDFISLKEYENIRLQTSCFQDMKELSSLILQITGSNLAAKQMNLEEERFLTYSYVCLEQTGQDIDKVMEEIQGEYVKFAHILPSSYQVNVKETSYQDQNFEGREFTKMGFTKQGTVLLAFSNILENYTKLPFIFEHEYLYSYLFALYQKISLKKISLEFEKKGNFEKARNELLAFTKSAWIQELTHDHEGSKLEKKWRAALELDYLYAEVKNKYDMMYKELNLEKTKKINVVMIGILIAILGIHILRFLI